MNCLINFYTPNECNTIKMKQNFSNFNICSCFASNGKRKTTKENGKEKKTEKKKKTNYSLWSTIFQKQRK